MGQVPGAGSGGKGHFKDALCSALGYFHLGLESDRVGLGDPETRARHLEMNFSESTLEHDDREAHGLNGLIHKASGSINSQ